METIAFRVFDEDALALASSLTVSERLTVCTQTSEKVVPHLNIAATLIFHFLTDFHGTAYSRCVKGQNKPFFFSDFSISH